jgi:hypothetical protein
MHLLVAVEFYNMFIYRYYWIIRENKTDEGGIAVTPTIILHIKRGGGGGGGDKKKLNKK